MTDPRYDDDDPEMSTFTHRSGRLWLPTAVIASALTAAHTLGLAFSIGAVAAWLLAVLFMTMHDTHDWQACPLCSEPERAFATPEARAKMARRHHNRWFSLGFMTTGSLLLMHAILPKPYMAPWWMKIVAGVFYLVCAVVINHDISLAVRHKDYQDECHLDWCRAGLNRPPGQTRYQRFSQWRGHYGVWLLPVLAPAVCVLGITSMHSEDLRPFYGIALLALVAVVGDMLLTHADTPCVYCAKSLPSNGGQSAERRMPWLRLFHVTRYWLLALAFLGQAASWALAGSVTAKMLVCACALLVVVWATLDRVHSPVRPWCPWCKDGGGEEESSEVPDPSESTPLPA